MRRNEKGITLVALVVTIIVLLILAGVSLSLVAGGNGILTRATGAVQKNENATAKEQAELKAAELVTEFYAVKYAGETATIKDTNNNTPVHSADTVRAGIAGSYKSDDGTYTITIDDSTGKITVSGTVSGKTVSGEANISETGTITEWNI